MALGTAREMPPASGGDWALHETALFHGQDVRSSRAQYSRATIIRHTSVSHVIHAFAPLPICRKPADATPRRDTFHHVTIRRTYESADQFRCHITEACWYTTRKRFARSQEELLVFSRNRTSTRSNKSRRCCKKARSS